MPGRLVRIATSRRLLWVAPAICAAVVAGYLAWGGWVSAAHQRWLFQSQDWWRVWLRPGNVQAPVLLVVLGLVALVCYWWPRRLQQQVALTIVVVMVLLGAILATAALAPCRGGQSYAAVAGWVLNLYVGNSPPLPNAACAGQPSLALQLAGIVCLGATLVGAVTVATALWRQPVDRLRARLVRDAVIFTGLDAMTIPFLEELARTGRPASIVVIEPDAGHPLLDQARATGARVMIGQPAQPRVLLPVIAGGRGCALRRLYALADDVGANEAVLAAAQGVLERYPPDPERQPHLVARIDDPRHADHWRGAHIGTSGWWLEDALSANESTASALANHVMDSSAEQLLLCGDSTLALAILRELARRAWEQQKLGEAAAAGRESQRGRPGTDGSGTDGSGMAGAGTDGAGTDGSGMAGAGTDGAGTDGSGMAGAGTDGSGTDGAPGGPPGPLGLRQVVLVDRRPEDLHREYLATSPVPVARALPGIGTAVGRWQDVLLETLDGMTPAEAAVTAVVVADVLSEDTMHKAGRVARLHPSVPVFVLSSGGAGAAGAIFGQLRPYQRSLLVDGQVPEDTWTRVARHWHECYRLQRPSVPAGQRAMTRRPWAELDEFIRQDNILQLRSVMSAVAACGRQWVPERAVVPGSFIELTDADLAEVARAEHTRWYRRRVAAGWKTSADAPDDMPRTGHALVNSRVVPWAELSPGDRAALVGYLRSQLSQLEDVGFVPVIPQGGPASAADFQRIGEVRARRMQTPRRWTQAGGAKRRARAVDGELSGVAGDWRVRDDQDDERTVRDAEFRASHEFLGGERWRRTGICRAWQVSDRQVLRTLEGRAVAQPGDWVVEGSGGERWPVTDGQFRRTYRAIPQK